MQTSYGRLQEAVASRLGHAVPGIDLPGRSQRAPAAVVGGNGDLKILRGYRREFIPCGTASAIRHPDCIKPDTTSAFQIHKALVWKYL
jgi:hypothetical protein